MLSWRSQLLSIMLSWRNQCYPLYAELAFSPQALEAENAALKAENAQLRAAAGCGAIIFGRAHNPSFIQLSVLSVYIRT
jgi:hypothetical protein